MHLSQLIFKKSLLKLTTVKYTSNFTYGKMPVTSVGTGLADPVAAGPIF